nr:DEAD/DEAH box helicase [candidate division Zixibacteria bacterium]
MRLGNLVKFDIPESIIEVWKRRQGDYLLPLQEKAIRSGLLPTGDGAPTDNLLISAPTSSGKSFCGEIAAVGSLLKRRKAVMLLPLKSIAEEKYHYYRSCYRSLGLRILIVTGDHPENDGAFELGNFDLVLAIYEKFNRLLTVNPDLLQQIGLVIVDELQMLSDPGRGPELEMVLGKMLSFPYSPRLVALSAVLGESSPEITTWLNCRVIQETVRPVDLLEGVASGGCFRFRSFNSGREGKERMELGGGDGDDSGVGGIIDFLAGSESPRLVFLKSRRDTIDAALRLAAAVNWGPAGMALDAIEGEEPGFLINSLKQVLNRGVAFHSADLTPRQRRAVENGYRRGEIRVVFSTTTLAMGVNLPAEMVLLETMKYVSGAPGGKPSLVPISLTEFRNISGRAGRFGWGGSEKPGRAVVLARSDFEYEILWSEYIGAGSNEKLVSALGGYSRADLVLDLIVSGLGADMSRLLSTVNNMLYYRCHGALTENEIEPVVAELQTAGLIRSSLEATPLGAAVAESGIKIESARHYLRLLDEKQPATMVGWLFLALSASEFDVARSGMLSPEYYRRTYERVLHRHFSEYIGEISAYSEIDIGREPLGYRMMALLKAVFMLTDWAGKLPVSRLERRYRLHHGQILNQAETAAWLLASLGRLIHARDCHSRIPAELADLAFRVQFGIDPAMKEIHCLTGDILNRADYGMLEERNIRSLDDLRWTPEESLREIIRPENKFRRLKKEIDNLEQEDKMQETTSSQMIPMRGIKGGSNSFINSAGSRPSLLELDGSYERERYLVRIDGFPVRLTGKSFKYLAKLASSRIHGNDGWIYKDDIEIGFNQARYLYRLKQEMKAGGVGWGIFENNRLGYYRLDLDPGRVKLNLHNLKSHSDYELRQIAQDLELKMAS